MASLDDVDIVALLLTIAPSLLVARFASLLASSHLRILAAMFSFSRCVASCAAASALSFSSCS